MKNPLVDFLASYGPQYSSNNLYDEFVVEASRRTGCAPLHINEQLVDRLEAMFRHEISRSVILTGTAGDGKTYTARKLVERLLDGTEWRHIEQRMTWHNTEKIFDLHHVSQSDRRLRFIKDLSELSEKEKQELYPEVTASLLGEGQDVFVVCVNDGHLLKFLRDHKADTDILYDRVVDMLQQDKEDGPDKHFLLINMSRQSHHDLVDNIIDEIVNRTDWAGCSDCPAFQSHDRPCPIQVNLGILRQNDASSMRARLKDMTRMAAADGRHLSIRQLILLTVNILLGDKKPGKALLTCTKARQRAAREDYSHTNPYANAFGANLAKRERQQYGAFAVLGDFGVGSETNNYFDHDLLHCDRHSSQDLTYERRIFKPFLDRYRTETGTNIHEFRSAITDQRRRLFFSGVPQAYNSHGDRRRDPWNLSAFQYGAAYIALADAVESGKRVPPEIRRSLFQGLNRMMTGEMTTTDDCIWLTEPSSVYLGQEIPTLIDTAGSQSQGATTFVTFPKADRNGRAPILRITPKGCQDLCVDLMLRPTLVECLLRIANGMLPASFSSECRQDIERFQLQVSSAIRRALSSQKLPRLIEMSDDNGTLRERSIDFMVNKEGW